LALASCAVILLGLGCSKDSLNARDAGLDGKPKLDGGGANTDSAWLFYDGGATARLDGAPDAPVLDGGALDVPIGTVTQTSTVTVTGTGTATGTGTVTQSGTGTNTGTVTATATATQTVTNTQTTTATSTSSGTGTATITATSTATGTGVACGGLGDAGGGGK
jgi:hypothetical protein